MPYGYGGFLNPYTMIIVILIVLQWFRVGNYGGAGAGVGPEPGLLSNGGLFIIAIFLLAYCSCGRPMGPVAAMPYEEKCHHKCHHH